MQKLTEEQLQIGRIWCLDCWPYEEDEISEASPEQIAKVIDKTYDGGLSEFIRVCEMEAA